jgi:lysophospholipase L1-like esterase
MNFAPQRKAPGSGSRIRWGRTLLLGPALAGVSVVAVLLLLELLLHLAAYPPQQTDHQRLFVEYDSVRGWRNVPSAAGDYVTEEYRVRLEYNARGIRGPQRPYAKPPHTYRIVVLGDSFVEGYMVPIEARVTEVLERQLNRGQSGPRVEVIALGTAGYSTDQELLWLESEGVRYEPDLVVAMFYANDVWYNAQPRYWRGGKPLFVFDADTLALTNVPVPRARLHARQNRFTLRDIVEENSKLFWLAAGALKNMPRMYALAIRAGLAEVPPEMVLDAGDELPVPAEFNVYRASETPETAQSWRTTQALLARMRRSAEQAGARFLVFLVPLRGDIYTREESVRENGERGASGWDPQAVARRFREVCAAERLQCVDPTEEFRASASKGGGSRLYYRYDWHWNAAGHALAARILARQIQAQWRDVRSSHRAGQRVAGRRSGGSLPRSRSSPSSRVIG